MLKRTFSVTVIVIYDMLVKNLLFWRLDGYPLMHAVSRDFLTDSVFSRIIILVLNLTHRTSMRYTMKLKPLHDWAVIVPSEAASRTAGGLYIPDSAKEKPEEGVVEAIGPGAYEEKKRGKKKEEKKDRKFIPTTVKPGDRVLYERYAGQTYTIDNEERVLVRERDILGLIDRPLQIPAATTPRSTTAIMERPAPSPVMKMQQKKVSGKTVKKKAKKAAKAPVKKAVKKKTAGKIVKKAATKSAKRSAKPAKARKSKVKKTGKKK
jgi:chaperonin GroES